MKDPIWLYWENVPDKKEPPYITLCRWTMLHHWKNENLIFLNSNNIECYLPGIKSKVRDIEVDVKGRLDLFLRRFTPNNLNLAVKCDYYRAHILKEYGGIYVDSSTIALKPLTNFFSQLSAQKSFIACQRSSHGKSHIPVSIYGALANSKIINTYANKLEQLVMQKKQLSYNDLGATTLTPIVLDNIQHATIIKERDIMPITYEDADESYALHSVDIAALVQDNCVFKLFNQPFKNAFEGYSINELYRYDGLLGQLFRYALPQKYFDQFMVKYQEGMA